MMRHSPLLQVLICVLGLSLLSGCLLSKIPGVRFYVINPLEGVQGLPGHEELKGPPAVEIGSLRLPQYLERPQIVTRDSENRLELSEFHQWGGNLRKNMMRVLAKNLSLLLGTPDIAIAPQRPSAPPDFRIEMEVMRFERDADGQVRLSAQWRLSGGKERKSLAARITELSSPAVSDKLDPEPTVAAMSALMGEMSRIIGRAILECARETTVEK